MAKTTTKRCGSETEEEDSDNLPSDIEKTLLEDIYYFENDLNATSEGEVDTSEETEYGDTGERYFFNEEEGGICTKCGELKEMGHDRKSCTEGGNSCYICGFKGHSYTSCDRVICSSCFLIGHTEKWCRAKRFVGHGPCVTCGLSGHSYTNCSLNSWRKYYFVGNKIRNTFLPTPERLHEENRKMILTCYNCSGRGHFGDDCPAGGFMNWSAFNKYTYQYVKNSMIINTKYKQKDYTRRHNQNPDQGLLKKNNMFYKKDRRG